MAQRECVIKNVFITSREIERMCKPMKPLKQNRVFEIIEREREREERERERRERERERERERDAICAKECGGDRVRGIARARSEL